MDDVVDLFDGFSKSSSSDKPITVEDIRAAAEMIKNSEPHEHRWTITHGDRAVVCVDCLAVGWLAD